MKKYKNELINLIQTHKKNWQNIIKSQYRYIYDDILANIPEIFKNQTISTYIYCYLNDIVEWPKCVICGKHIEKLNTNALLGFRKTCIDRTCINTYKYMQTKNAIQEKYGVDNVFSLNSTIQKSRHTKKDRYGSETYNNSEQAKQTNLDKYGVDNPAKAECIKNKTKQKCLDMYGVEYFWQAECIKQKIKEKSLELYGIENPGASKESLEKIIKTLQDKYGVSWPGELLRNDIYANKSKNTCLDRYGVEYASQSKKTKQQNVKACIDKYGCSNYAIYASYQLMLQNEFDQPEFSLSDLDNLKNCNKMLQFRCLKCNNIFEAKHVNGMHQRCPKCFPQTLKSIEEHELYEFIKSQLPSIDICKNSRSIISPLELDIFIPSLNLAFEFDGLYWHQYDNACLNDKRKYDKEYHLKKTLECEEKNIQLIHVFENEWISKSKIIKSRICNILGIYESIIYARKCIIKHVENKIANDFLNENHLQGALNSKINLGLYYNDELVSLMTFGKSRFSKKYEWELLRFCNKLGCHIPGAAGKLLTYFEREFHPKSLISYADRRWSKGKLYEALGFTFDHASSPNYWYWKQSTNEFLSRISCQKHKLKNILPFFDENMSEVQNMRANGYSMIYDCGNLVYVKEYK